MLHTRMGVKWPRGRPWTTWIDHSRKNIEIRGENWEEIQETGSERIEVAGDLLIVDPYLWKQLKNNDDDEINKMKIRISVGVLNSIWWDSKY